MGVPYIKSALTFSQQLDQLVNRGLLVGDRDRALSTLARISYYRLSAYWFPFRANGNDSFEDGASFEHAVELYEYDRRLRLLVMDAVERVEVALRTSVTYRLGHAYGAFAHERPSNFRPTFDHARWYDRDLLPEISRAKEKFLDHFRSKYSGFPSIPIWMASEVMSLGTLSKLFKGMLAQDQREVVKAWGVLPNVAESWFHALTYVRNVCAHHGRLWNRELAISPRIPKRPEWSGVTNNRRVYGLLCILRHLTESHSECADWAEAVVELLDERDGQPRWQSAMGCPSDWAQHTFWAQFGARVTAA